MIIGPKSRLRGCDHCAGPVMTIVRSLAGRVELCWEHTLRFTGWDTERLEGEHRPFRDHIHMPKSRPSAVPAPTPPF